MELFATEALDVAIAGLPVCRNLTLAVQAGERWCILGRNGTGKTTLLHTLAGLRDADSGTVRVAGTPLAQLGGRERARRIGILLQDSSDLFPATVMETVLSGRHPWLGPLQWESGRDREIARKALHAAGLDGFAERNVQTLSGGERRRLGIATLLVQDTRLLLADEPASHLDIHYQVAMLSLLSQQAVQDERAVLMVLHDVNLAQRFCSHALLLYGDGDCAHGPVSTMLDEQHLQQVYRHPLLRIEGRSGPCWVAG